VIKRRTQKMEGNTDAPVFSPSSEEGQRALDAQIALERRGGADAAPVTKPATVTANVVAAGFLLNHFTAIVITIAVIVVILVVLLFVFSYKMNVLRRDFEKKTTALESLILAKTAVKAIKPAPAASKTALPPAANNSGDDLNNALAVSPPAPETARPTQADLPPIPALQPIDEEDSVAQALAGAGAGAPADGSETAAVFDAA
jgi:Flp pilus assembly protein TadB